MPTFSLPMYFAWYMPPSYMVTGQLTARTPYSSAAGSAMSDMPASASGGTCRRYSPPWCVKLYTWIVPPDEADRTSKNARLVSAVAASGPSSSSTACSPPGSTAAAVPGAVLTTSSQGAVTGLPPCRNSPASTWRAGMAARASSVSGIRYAATAITTSACALDQIPVPPSISRMVGRL